MTVIVMVVPAVIIMACGQYCCGRRFPIMWP